MQLRHREHGQPGLCHTRHKGKGEFLFRASGRHPNVRISSDETLFLRGMTTRTDGLTATKLHVSRTLRTIWPLLRRMCCSNRTSSEQSSSIGHGRLPANKKHRSLVSQTPDGVVDYVLCFGPASSTGCVLLSVCLFFFLSLFLSLSFSFLRRGAIFTVLSGSGLFGLRARSSVSERHVEVCFSGRQGLLDVFLRRSGFLKGVLDGAAEHRLGIRNYLAFLLMQAPCLCLPLTFFNSGLHGLIGSIALCLRCRLPCKCFL